MQIVRVHNQAELDAALAKGGADIWICGTGIFELSGSAQVTAYGSAQVTARDSAQVRAYDSAQVTAYGSAQVTAYDSAQVTAYGSAQVTARDSAQVRASDSAQVRASGSAQVTAYGSAQVTACDSAQVWASDSAQVWAYGSAQVTASDSAQVRATAYVAVTIAAEATAVKVDGGVVIRVPPVTTPAAWCERYGVPVSEDGIATLYKAVRDDYRSAHGFSYTPGTQPAAPDWDGGKAECGGGLHFSPRPWMARRFDADATRYVACPVRMGDIVVHHPAAYPDKVKAPSVCAPIYECDQDGQPLVVAR